MTKYFSRQLLYRIRNEIPLQTLLRNCVAAQDCATADSVCSVPAAANS